MPFSENRFPDKQPRFHRAERRFQGILVGGFALVILLMVTSGLLGLYAMQRLGESTEKMSQRYLVQSRLADQLQHEQGSLGILLYNLVSERPDARLTGYRDQAEAQRDRILRLTHEATTQELHSAERDAWNAIKNTAGPLFSEILRLIEAGRTNSADLSVMHRHFIADTAHLMDTAYADVESDRTVELTRESNIIRNSRTLLIVSGGVAIFCAVLCVLGSLTLFHGLEKQAETLGRLSAHTLAEQEEAARRFSQEMHDEFGQTLNAIESTLSSVKARDEVHQARLDDAIGLSKEAQGMAREMSQLLRPRILDDFGLDAGLRELARGFSRRSGIAVDYTSSFRDRLDPGTETQLFRIAQEALTNTARHTTASTVGLSLTQEGGLLKLRALDNGGGMAGGAPSLSSLGLLGMRERARACGGRLIVTSTPGKGVEVVAEIPRVTPAAEPGISINAPADHASPMQPAATSQWEKTA